MNRSYVYLALIFVLNALVDLKTFAQATPTWDRAKVTTTDSNPLLPSFLPVDTSLSFTRAKTTTPCGIAPVR